MRTVLLIIGLLTMGWLVYNRRRVIASIPMLQAIAASLVGGSQPSELGPLIAALYSSLTDKSRRTWWTRTYHVTGEGWTILAAPADAGILASAIPAVEADLNAALRDNAHRHRIVVEAPLKIRGVLSDESMVIGRPQLHPDEVFLGVARTANSSSSRTTVLSGNPRALNPRADRAATWEMPTKHAATIGETLVASVTSARLWPVGPRAGDDPIAVPEAGVVLGRSADLGVGRIVSRTVSGHHAELHRKGDAWIIKDLGSRNGTFLGARRVNQAKIQSGDVIGLGRHVRLRLIFGEQPLEFTVRDNA